MINIKYSIKYSLITIFLIIVSIPVYSETGSDRHFNLGGGWAFTGLRDKGLSPLYYSGKHAYVSSGLRSSSGHRLFLSDIGFMVGNIYPSINPELTDSEMRNMKLELNFAHLRHLTSILSDDLILFLGGSLGSRFAYYRHSQFVNNSITAYSISTLNLDSQLSYRFLVAKDRGLQITLRIGLPLAAILFRPSYAYIAPSGFLDHNTGNVKSLFNSVELSTMNRFFSLNSNLSLEYPLRNNNALRVYYHWEYSNHKNVNQLQTATHGIILQTMFNF